MSWFQEALPVLYSALKPTDKLLSDVNTDNRDSSGVDSNYSNSSDTTMPMNHPNTFEHNFGRLGEMAQRWTYLHSVNNSSEMNARLFRQPYPQSSQLTQLPITDIKDSESESDNVSESDNIDSNIADNIGEGGNSEEELFIPMDGEQYHNYGLSSHITVDPSNQSVRIIAGDEGDISTLSESEWQYAEELICSGDSQPYKVTFENVVIDDSATQLLQLINQCNISEIYIDNSKFGDSNINTNDRNLYISAFFESILGNPKLDRLQIVNTSLLLSDDDDDDIDSCDYITAPMEGMTPNQSQQNKVRRNDYLYRMVSKHPSLQHIILHNVGISNASIFVDALLNRNFTLETLDLSYNQLNPNDIKQINWAASQDYYTKFPQLSAANNHTCDPLSTSMISPLHPFTASQSSLILTDMTLPPTPPVTPPPLHSHSESHSHKCDNNGESDVKVKLMCKKFSFISIGECEGMSISASSSSSLSPPSDQSNDIPSLQSLSESASSSAALQRNDCQSMINDGLLSRELLFQI